ncbi:hypothetical protein SRHO_G00321380 [Serrasalmus rhombeus]
MKVGQHQRRSRNFAEGLLCGVRKYLSQSIGSARLSVRQSDTCWPQQASFGSTSRAAPPTPTVAALPRGKFINYDRMFDWHRRNDGASLLT